jgi:ribosomal protein L11 methyltransferase
VPSSWLQLSLRTHPSALDAVSNFLIERGSPGVVIKKNEVQAYFVNSAESSSVRRDVQRFLRGIRSIYPDVSERHLHWKILKERNWNRAWRRFFTPQRIGKMFWVTPPWIKPPSFRRRQVILIEPGMAFGTGTHATTRACLELIEKVAPELSGKQFTALDLGTGSGILAIALAKLGVKKIIALDNDPVALKVARENVCSNGVQEQIVLSRSNLVQVRKPFLLVVANLTAEAILEIADELTKRVPSKGYLILSGILKPKEGDVSRRFYLEGFRIVERKGEKEWMTLLLKRT